MISSAITAKATDRAHQRYFRFMVVFLMLKGNGQVNGFVSTSFAEAEQLVGERHDGDGGHGDDAGDQATHTNLL